MREREERRKENRGLKKSDRKKQRFGEKVRREKEKFEDR